jgi:type III pantothenate kinase
VDLEIDAGNSRLKWRLRGDDKAWPIRLATTPADIVHAIANDNGVNDRVCARIDRVRIASVRSPESLSELVVESSRLFGLDPEVAKVMSTHAGVTIRYSDPSRLGVDRWLAMLAAHAASTKACLVVDCGTALTIDKLTESGEHCGGYIIPGLALMRRSLEENTRIRLNKEFEIGGVALGHSTDEAVYHGTLAAAVALIKAKFEESNQEEVERELFITGGGADELMPHLKHCRARHMPDLVLDGLSLAF